ncbi:MAG: DNA translocase FtsK [Ruminococcaceae bacterium]|nr:DNA translocase FtsK [Oscillospiraceae bacterium]
MPICLFICFVTLLMHEGRPVKARVICALIVTVCVGALVHLFSAKTNVEWSVKIFADLWNGGNAGTAGGVLSGFLAMLLKLLISKAGAIIVFLVAALVLALYSMNMTPMSIIRAIHNRPRPEYKPPEEPIPDTAETIVNHVAQKRIEHNERKEQKRVQRESFDFDLPVDGPVADARKQRQAKKEEKKEVVSPDAYLIARKAMEDAAKTSSKKSEPELKPHPEVEQLIREEEAEQTQIPDVVADNIAQMPPLEMPEQQQKVRPEEAAQAAAEVAAEIAMQEEPQQVYSYPPVELLNNPDSALVDGTEEMRVNAERLNSTLRSFSIEAEIINVTRGPSVTRYELRLHEGIKLSKLTNLADDIALALGASGIRISAIPDKISVVGIEVPNRLVSTVHIREVIDSDEFMKHKSKISFAVGKDIGGNRIVGDITRLPHLLIAGTTGSGKSVCMNSLIISLLYKAKPDEVRLIMVDPKMVELGIYNGIPHLLIPVVTDPKKAAGALQWSVNEMMRRYRLMADVGVRDLEAYNKVADKQEDLKHMEQIVVVIDELADLMLVAAKEVEESICRIAQMGRAAGMHLVIATQRPSADVITGLMKANIPSRIAFAVASAMESRIILDASGAEKLVGKGDMLYAPLGFGKQRVQGCFITDKEVQAVVDHIKNATTANYSDEVMAQIEKSAEQTGKQSAASASGAALEPMDESDELLPAAVDVILETGQASVSMLQRRLKLGYARAARIVDEMEERGYVGPFEGSKPRQLLITKEQWAAIQSGVPLEDLQENPPVEEEIP